MEKRQDTALKVMAALAFLLDEQAESIDVGKIDLHDINANDLFTSILMAVTTLYNELTTNSEDMVGMTHLLNRLAIQHVIDAVKAQEDEIEDGAE